MNNFRTSYSDHYRKQEVFRLVRNKADEVGVLGHSQMNNQQSIIRVTRVVSVTLKICLIHEIKKMIMIVDYSFLRNSTRSSSITQTYYAIHACQLGTFMLNGKKLDIIVLTDSSFGYGNTFTHSLIIGRLSPNYW